MPVFMAAPRDRVERSGAGYSPNGRWIRQVTRLAVRPRGSSPIKAIPRHFSEVLSHERPHPSPEPPAVPGYARCGVSSPRPGCSPTSSSRPRRRPRGRSTRTSCRSTPTTTCSSSTTTITPAVGEITHLTGRILDAEGQPGPQRPGRDLAVRRQGRLPAHRRQRREEGPAGQALPGLRPLPDRLDRRVLLPHDQAGPVPRPHAAHPLQDQEGRQGTARHAVLHQGPPGQRRRTASTAASATRRRRDAITVDFTPIKESKIGELAAKFDIVLGRTPESK